MATVKKHTAKDGTTSWRVRVYAGRDPETGMQRFTTRTFAKKKDADREANRLEHMKDIGGLVQPAKDPLGKYLRRWLRDVMAGRVRERTWLGYSGVLRRYVEEPDEALPAVGKIRVDRLMPGAIQGLYGAMRDRGLSPRTIRSLHAVIRQGLAHAARTGAVGRNVADLVVLPKMQKREVRAMSQEEAGRFLEAAKGDRYYALWCTLLTGGLRPGEALGLQWPDVDLDAGKVHVQRNLVRLKRRKQGEPTWRLTAPKTDRARRVVVLPGFAIDALRAHRAAQARERLLVGGEYEDHGFVFANEFGRPLSEANLSKRNYRHVCAAAELGTWGPEPVKPVHGPTPERRFNPAYRMYDLRHTAATLLLRAGVNPKVTSERLGHSSVAFTMDVYSASLPDLQEEAAEKMEAMLGSA